MRTAFEWTLTARPGLSRCAHLLAVPGLQSERVTKTVELWKKLGSLRRPVVVSLIGVGFVVTYELLSAFEVGKIGAPSDIGGGGILLIGYIFLGSGLISLVVKIRRLRAADRGK